MGKTVSKLRYIALEWYDGESWLLSLVALLNSLWYTFFFFLPMALTVSFSPSYPD